MSCEIVFGSPVGHWVASQMYGMYAEGQSQAIGLERNGKLVAGVIYEDWNHRSIVCHIAAIRLTREFLQEACGYAFNVCGVNKIIAPVDSDNEKARRFVQKMGFVLEATIRDATARGDFLLFTMTRQQCRYLERNGKIRHSASYA